MLLWNRSCSAFYWSHSAHSSLVLFALYRLYTRNFSPCILSCPAFFPLQIITAASNNTSPTCCVPAGRGRGSRKRKKKTAYVIRNFTGHRSTLWLWDELQFPPGSDSYACIGALRRLTLPISNNDCPGRSGGRLHFFLQVFLFPLISGIWPYSKGRSEICVVP